MNKPTDAGHRGITPGDRTGCYEGSFGFEKDYGW